MMRHSPSNLAFIRRHAAAGATANLIYLRILERLVWHGPIPSVDEIDEVMRSTRPAQAGTSGPPDAGRAVPSINSNGGRS